MNDPTGGASKPPRPPAPSAPDTSGASAKGEARPEAPAAKPPLPPRPDAKAVKPPLPPRALSNPSMPAQRATSTSTSAPQTVSAAPPPPPPPPPSPPPILDAEPSLDVEPSLDMEIVDPLASTADIVEEPVSSRSRRSYERFPVEVSVDFVSEHNFFTGFSLNVSEGGLFVATHVVRPVGSLLEIRLALPDSPEPLVLQTEVRWVREHNADSDASPGLGLRFLEISKDAEARIHTFMKRVRDPLFYDDE